jgi:spore maturation protein CgeB
MSRVLLNFRAGFAGLREGFEGLGCDVVENRWAPEGAALEGVALCVADFVDCAREVRRTVGLRRRLARARIPFVTLNRDAPFNRGVHPLRLAVLRRLKPFDAYATHSMQGAGRYARRTLYCPNAARESVYRVSDAELTALRDPARYRWDVSFVGNLDVARFGEHARRVEFLQGLSTKLDGQAIRTSFRDSAGMSADEQVGIIQASRINLSVMAACDAGAQASWGLPERCYGVPACGGFLLADRRRHAAEDFAEDERAEYDDIEDCVRKIRHFLAHFGQARAIAERARARVVRDHGYRNRAARLLDWVRHGR